MRIKRYLAASVGEALELVRLEMGSDALILQTRKVRCWWMPWQKPRVEVVAACEPMDRRRRQPGGMGAGAGARPGAGGRLPSAFGPILQAATQAPGPSREAASQSQGPSGEPFAGRAHARHSEWALPGDGRGRSVEAAWLQRLLDLDVEAPLAWDVVRRAAVLSRAGGLAFEEAVAQSLQASVPVQEVWERTGRPRVVMLVGPTGVGKTTTVAKLAANFALVAGWKVGLVTADTYRIGAVEQLRTYGELLGTPLDVVRDAAELRQVLAGSHQDLVLIDTSGHSPSDPSRLAALEQLCQALPREAEVLLVVSAPTRQEDLADVVEHYRKLPLTGVCVTKLDETRRRGALVNAPHRLQRPLVFVTTGQAVPDDIEAVDPGAITRWLLQAHPQADKSWVRRPDTGG